MADTPVWRMMHADADGAVYWHGTPADRVRDDAGEAIAHELEGSPSWQGSFPAAPAALEMHFDRLDLSVRASTSRYRLAYRTPYGESAEQLARLRVGVWDESVWDADVWTGPLGATWQDTHVAVGLRGTGRWLVPIVRHDIRGDQFGVGVLELVAFPVARFSTAR